MFKVCQKLTSQFLSFFKIAKKNPCIFCSFWKLQKKKYDFHDFFPFLNFQKYFFWTCIHTSWIFFVFLEISIYERISNKNHQNINEKLNSPNTFRSCIISFSFFIVSLQELSKFRYFWYLLFFWNFRKHCGKDQNIILDSQFSLRFRKKCCSFFRE